MAELVPINFPIPSSSQSLNVSLTDVASGIGWVSLEGVASTTTDSATLTYFSLPTAFGSSVIPKSTNLISSGHGSTTFVVVQDQDFDMTPNAFTTTAKGTAFVEVTWQVENSSSNGAQGYCEFNVIHVDADSNETNIGTVVSDTIGPGGGVVETTTDFLHATLTETLIKPNEKLRLNIKLYSKVDSGSTDGGCGLTFDPTNSDVSSGMHANITAASNHTYLRFHIPFKIQN